MPAYDLAEGDPTAENVQKMIGPVQSGIAYVPQWVLKIALAGGAQNAFAVSQENPFGVDVIITRAVAHITTLGGSANAVLDVDIATSATGTGDDILDGIPMGSGGATGIYDSLNGTDNGSNGEGKSHLWEKAGGTNDFVTAKILVAEAAALVGELFLYCHPAE